MSLSKFSFKDVPSLIKETLKEWFKDRPLDQSAIVAFYSIFGLPGFLMIVITIAGSVFGQEAVEGRIEKEIGEIIGRDAGRGIQNLIANVYTKGHSMFSFVIGIVILLFASTGIFAALKRELNKTLNVAPKHGKFGLKKILINRITSFLMILAIGFLLLVSLIITSLLSLLSNWIKSNFSDFILNISFIIHFLLSFGLVTTMFALIYKFLPDSKFPRKAVWVGTCIASLLFIIGNFSISIYFKSAQPGSPYGVAGFFILLILWITYSCLVVFLGAKFILIFSRRYFNK